MRIHLYSINHAPHGLRASIVWFIKPHFPFDLRGVTRVFTISSAPEEETLCFTTRYFDDQSSSFKRALFRMQPGERLWAYGPSPLYDYFRALDTGRQYVFLAGGIGITPVRATLIHHAATSGGLTATLLYANRDTKCIFKDDLSGLRTTLPALGVTYITSPEHISAAAISAAARPIPPPFLLLPGHADLSVAWSAFCATNWGCRKKISLRICLGPYRSAARDCSGRLTSASVELSGRMRRAFWNSVFPKTRQFRGCVCAARAASALRM